LGIKKDLTEALKTTSIRSQFGIYRWHKGDYSLFAKKKMV
jgi:hypothetical protein